LGHLSRSTGVLELSSQSFQKKAPLKSQFDRMSEATAYILSNC
jgi:hypothetical protein